jgi:hypothetical protein
MSPGVRRGRHRRLSATGKSRTLAAAVARDPNLSVPLRVVSVATSGSNWRWRIIDGVGSPVGESEETFPNTALAIAAGRRHLGGLDRPSVDAPARRRPPFKRVAASARATTPVDDLQVILNAPIETESLTEGEMDVPLRRIRFPARLLDEYHRWAPPAEREPAFRLLMEIWNAVMDQRIQRTLEVGVFGRSRNAYGTPEQRGLLAEAYRISDELLRAINDAAAWADHIGLREPYGTPTLLYSDAVTHLALQPECSLLEEALPLLERARDILQRGLDSRTTGRQRGRKKTTTLLLSGVSPQPLTRRQIQGTLRDWLLLARVPSTDAAPRALRTAARHLADQLVDHILS